MPSLGRKFLFGLALCALLIANQRITAEPDGFAPGDIFVSLSNGDVQWRHADGTLNQILHTGAGPAKAMAFDSAGNLYVPHWYSSDLSGGNTVAKLAPSGALSGVFG